MGWIVVDTETGDVEMAGVKWGSEEAATKHANYLNAEEKRKHGEV